MEKLVYLFLGVVIISLLVACKGKKIKEAANGLPSEAFHNLEIRETFYKHLKDIPNGAQVSVAVTSAQERDPFVYHIKRENDTLNLIKEQDYAYEIGSISKVFTSTVLADAVINKNLHLDDVVNKQYDFTCNKDIQLTYKSLSNHTSGLARLPSNLGILEITSKNPYAAYDQKRLYDYLKNEVTLDYTPGDKSVYSNTGVAILGDALSRLYDQKVEDIVQQRIFDPYKMELSTFNRSEVEQLLVPPLDDRGKPTSNWDMNVFNSTGGIISTVGDLSRFMKRHFVEGDEVLALSRKRTFTINKQMDIALGWHIIKAKNAKTYHWHNGGTGGYSSSLAMDVENKAGVVVLSNLSALGKNTSGKADALCFDLLKILK